MRTALVVTAAVLLLHNGMRAARANFVLETNSPTVEGTPVAPRPGPAPVTRTPNPAMASGRTTAIPTAPISTTRLRPRRDPNQPINLPPPPSFSVPNARGFGHEVPLSFAVRQIVPAKLRVSYANRLDTDALVNWQGGEPWNVVLVNAVKPLGYQVWVSSTTVHIYR